MTSLPPPLDSRQRALVLALFLTVLGAAALFAGGHTYAIDNEVQYQTTRSLARLEPQLDLVNPRWRSKRTGPYRHHPGGGDVAVVGLGQSLAALPLYGLSAAIARLLPEDERDAFIRTGTFFTNSIVLALTAVVLTLASQLFTGSFAGALLVGGAYAGGTYAFPHAKTFFTEPGTALLVLVAVWMSIRNGRSPTFARAFTAGLAVVAAVVFRVTAALFVPIVASFLGVMAGLRHGRSWALRSGIAFAVGTSGPLLLLGMSNWWRFGHPLDPGYLRVPLSNPVLRGLAGQLVSPGKSLFLFAPLLPLSVLGFAAALGRRQLDILLPLSIVATNLVFFSCLPFWHGDHAWGPRYQQIVLPCLALLAAPVTDWRFGRRALATLSLVGFVAPALLGSLLYFNAYFVSVERALGRPAAPAIREELTWQPFLGHLGLLPRAFRDVIGDVRPGERRRAEYSADPATHYGFFSGAPRVDVWWLWVGPTRGSALTYGFLLPILGCLFTGLRLFWVHRGALRVDSTGLRQ